MILRHDKSDWRKSEIVKGFLLFFAIGAAWASLTFQVHGLTKYMEVLDSRVDHLEQFLTKESHGQFARQDNLPKGDPQ